MTQPRFWNALTTVFVLLGVNGGWAQDRPAGGSKAAPCPRCCEETACPQAASCSKCCPKDACAVGCKAACAQCPLCQKRKEREIERRLSPAISVDFRDTPLKDALENLRELIGLNMVLDMPALEKEAICLDRPLTIHVEQVTARSVLNLVLHQAGLVYVIKDEVVLVTTEAGARGRMVERIYPVADLILAMACPPAPLPPAGPGACSGPCSASESCITPAVVRDTNSHSDEAAPGQLIKVITNTIKPETWSEMGGPGTIEYYPLGMAVVVNNSADVQEQVANLLAALERLLDDDCPNVAPPPAMAMPPMMPPPPIPYVMPFPHPAPNYLYAPAPAGVYQAQPAAVPCAMPLPGGSPALVLRVAAAKDQAKMVIQGGDTRLTCETLSLDMADGKIKLCVREGQIRLSGPHFEAVADHLTRTGTEDRVILEGHVRVKYVDDHAKVTADSVVIGLKDGRLEIQPKSASADKKKEGETVFQFWQGVYR
jgi:hypothetical protein